MSTLKQFRQGLGAPSNPTSQGSAGLVDSQEIVPIKPVSRLQYNSVGASSSVSLLNEFDFFSLLPAAVVAAGTDKLVTLLGTNTPLVSQSTTGGALFSTGGTNTNQSGVTFVASTGFSVPISATNQIIFRARVNLPSLVTNFFSIGMNSVGTSASPNTNAGEGACFLADPTNNLTASTGATAAQALNWICVNSLAGVMTYTFTNVPIFAGQDVMLALVLNPNLTWSFYINEILVANPVTLSTLTTVIGVYAAVRTLANTVATAIIRFAQLERSIG